MVAPVRLADVRNGIATFLNAESVGVWKKSTAYSDSDRAVFVRQMQSAPDTAVAVETYDTQDGLVLPDVEIRVQLLFRGHGDAADDFADDVFAVLHGRHQFTAGTLTVQRARRLYTTPLGVDDNGREQRSDNYALIFMR